MGRKRMLAPGAQTFASGQADPNLNEPRSTGLPNEATGNRVKVADHVVRPTQRN